MPCAWINWKRIGLYVLGTIFYLMWYCKILTACSANVLTKKLNLLYCVWGQYLAVVLIVVKCRPVQCKLVKTNWREVNIIPPFVAPLPLPTLLLFLSSYSTNTQWNTVRMHNFCSLWYHPISVCWRISLTSGYFCSFLSLRKTFAKQILIPNVL